MKIIVDADACPKSVLQMCMEAGARYGVPVWTVAGFNHNIISDHHVTVGDSSQEADIKVINLAAPGDIAVTQDFGLAAVLLGKGLCCLSPHGTEYTATKIEFMLEEREAKARFRRGGGRTRGPKKRSADDDRRFAALLERVLGST
ncbi:MAG: DUF188 domain-containing protein [Dethiobacter sp.]|nr:DUF188 domain-containing protein [Dethiobacter sp.]